MRNIVKATITSYLVAVTAYGPWAFAQPKIVPVPATEPPVDRPVRAAQAPSAPDPAVPAKRKTPLSRKWKLAPNAAQPGAPPAVAAPVAAAPAPAATPTTTTVTEKGLVELPGEKEFNSCKKLPSGKAILKMGLKPDTEIGDLIGTMSSITCTPFLIPSTVGIAGKKVTVIAPQALTPAEYYRLFYAALESVGLTVEPSGRFLRIVDTGRARMTKLPYYGDHDSIPRDKRFITKLVRVENLDATELVNSVLNRIKGETGDIIAYRASLIITDTAENVERMVEIIKDFDIPSAFAESLWMIRVKNMSATEMASRLAEILPVQQVGGGGARRAGAPAAAPPPAAGKGAATALPGDLNAEMTINKIVPDERSNSLLVVANQRAYEWLLTIVRRLDMPLDSGDKSGDGKVHVYYCENANCDELAATLSAVAGVSVVGGVGGGGARRTRTSTPGAAPAPIAAPAAPGQQNTSSLLFEGDVRITFDAPTNSLLVVSSFKDFQALRKVIERLDAPRKQVFIEALILEVSLDKSRETGVAYHGGYGVPFPGNEKSLLLGGFEASKTLNPTSLISNLGGLTGALFGPTIPSTQVQLFGTAVQLPSFGVFLQLLQTNNDVNVLSNPSLLITNNQEGEISVGENLPFPGQLLGGFGGLGGGQQGGFGGLGIPSVGVQRQDVALKMKLIPSVNEHNMIRLEVDQEISDVSAPNFNGLGPATSKRAAKTTVVARDQQTVVIGGLMTDRASETVKKIPILGDIPVLGFFFRSTSKSTVKKNIIIAITPYVISDLSDLRRVAEKKLRERREFIERYSALEDKMQYEANLDYTRKRGILEEINRTAREIEVEEEEMRRIRERNTVEESVQLGPPGRRAPSGPRVPVSSTTPGPAPVPAMRSLAPAAPAAPGAVAPAPVAAPAAGAPPPPPPPPPAAPAPQAIP